MSPSEAPARRVGYVLKMYPRFSETFIVNEILALEAAGEHLDIFSLRLPVDGRFHEQLADVRAPVTYLPHQLKPAELWELLQHGLDSLPRLSVDLPDVLALGVNDAACAVQLAILSRDLGITHLHAHFASVATDVARVAARLAGISYSFTAHAKDIYHESVEPASMRRKLADASAVVTVSDYNLRHLRRTYGSAADHVVRIYNGIDLERYAFDPPGERAPRSWSRSGAWWRRRASPTSSTQWRRWSTPTARFGSTSSGSATRSRHCARRSPRSTSATRCASSARCRRRRCARWCRPLPCWPHRAWWEQTATGTGCRRCCSRRWRSVPRAWPRP